MSEKQAREHISPKRWLLDLLAGSRMRFDLLRFNFGPLITVVAIYTFLASILVVPLFSRATQAIMDLSGLESLTVENAATFLTNPLTLLCTLALFVFLAFYVMIDLGSAIFTFDAARQRVHVSIRAIFVFSFKNAIRIFRPKNLPIILVCLVMVPFVGLATASSLFSVITIPTALLYYIRSNTLLLMAFLVLIAACFVLSLRWMYVLHFYTVEGVDFPEAARKSMRLKRSQRIQNLVSMLIIQGILAALNKVVSLVGLTLVAFVLDTLGAKSMVGAVIASTILVAFVVIGGILALVGTPIGALKIGGKFYQLMDAVGEKVRGVACKEAVISKKVIRIDHAVGVAIIVLIIVGLSLYANLVATGRLENNMLNATRPEIVALEGGGAGVSQDTLASLDAVMQQGADGVVVHTQISKDGVVFLAISPDMAMSSGVQGDSWDMDFEEIHASSLKVRHSEDKAVPRLSEAIQRASDDGLSLILDVSSLASREGALEAVIDELRSADALSWCEIATDSYDDLVRVRSLEPDAKTVFVASVSGSEYDTLTAANAIAVEGALISKDNVAAIHKSGRKAYAWNVSGSSNSEAATRAKVDTLVSQDISTAIEAADRSGLSAVGYAFFSRL